MAGAGPAPLSHPFRQVETRSRCCGATRNLAEFEPAVRHVEIGVNLNFQLAGSSSDLADRLSSGGEVGTRGLHFQVVMQNLPSAAGWLHHLSLRRVSKRRGLPLLPTVTA
jgi:hypothetical protein